MPSSRTSLKQRAALAVLSLVVFASCLGGAFVYGTSFAPPATRGNLTIIEAAQNKPAPPVPEATPPAPQPVAAPELSEAAKLALKREEYRNRLEAMGIKAPAYRWFQSERVLVWAQLPDPKSDARDEEWYTSTYPNAASPAMLENWLSAFEADYGECDAGRNGQPPVTAIVFRRDYDFRRWVWQNENYTVPSWAGGLYLHSRDVALVPCGEYWRSDADVLCHEVFHAFQFRCAPTCSNHSWFVEGSASWVQRAEIHNGKLRRGTWDIRGYYGYLRYLLRCGVKVDVRDLFALSPEQFYANPLVNYLAAYLLVDFILEHEELRAVYFEYWKLLRSGKSADDAFRATFGKLDLEALNKRFIGRVRTTPVSYFLPRLICDAPRAKAPNQPLPMPELTEEQDDEGVDVALQKLKEAGFDINRPFPIDRPMERVAICADSSEPASIENLNQRAFNRWLNCCNWATDMYSRPQSFGLPQEPPLSLAVLFILIESVLDGKEAAFCEATGIRLPKDLPEYLRAWASGEIEFKTMRECYVAAANAYLGGQQQSVVNLVVLDFRSDVISSEGWRPTTGKLEQVFDSVQRARKRANKEKETGCDWFKALSAAATSVSDRRGIVLFFTHSRPGGETGAILDEWRRKAGRRTSLLLVGAPGADAAALEEIAKLAPGAKLDDWQIRFGK